MTENSIQYLHFNLNFIVIVNSSYSILFPYDILNRGDCKFNVKCNFFFNTKTRFYIIETVLR